MKNFLWGYEEWGFRSKHGKHRKFPKKIAKGGEPAATCCKSALRSKGGNGGKMLWALDQPQREGTIGVQISIILGVGQVCAGKDGQ